MAESPQTQTNGSDADTDERTPTDDARDHEAEAPAEKKTDPSTARDRTPANQPAPSEPATDSTATAGADTATDTPEQTAAASSFGLLEARERAHEMASELFEHEFDSVIKINKNDNGTWRTVVEVVERSAVPDTQDILGRYEIVLDSAGNATQYELLERYQRGAMKEEL
ncbi:MAG: gas vesicle synthesis protein GvpO [halophilic archaeon J07HX5]|nr:MAG: gas vesicle synthesis protein GvpO [halophilic archaeon J07HX5]